jgi:hypothetical protein
MEGKHTIGHILPCLAQLTILSAVERAYSTPFFGCSREAWLDPTLAKSKAWEGLTEGTEAAEREEEGTERAVGLQEKARRVEGVVQVRRRGERPARDRR